MDTRVEGGNGQAAPRKRRIGRKDEGQEKIISLGPIREALPELIRLKNAATAAAADYGDAIKAKAEQAGVNAKNLRTLVDSKASDTFIEKARDVAQLALLFDTSDQ